MAQKSIAGTQSALSRYDRLKKETEAQAQAMTPKAEGPGRVTGALIRGKENIKSAARATYDVARSKLRGRQMRRDLEEKKRRTRSLGTALGERAKYFQRMNELGRKPNITLEDYAGAMHGEKGLAERRKAAEARKASPHRRQRPQDALMQSRMGY